MKLSDNWDEEMMNYKDNSTKSESMSQEDDENDLTEDVTQSSIEMNSNDSIFLDQLIVRLMSARRQRFWSSSRLRTRYV